DLTHQQRDRPNAYIELPAPVRARYIRYEHVYTAGPHLAISDLRVFGRGEGAAPATPRNIKVRRADLDERNVFLAWDDGPGAVGCSSRWAIRPDKLYQTYQVFADDPPRLEIRALTLGQGYSFAIEAFNENGVSATSAAKEIF